MHFRYLAFGCIVAVFAACASQPPAGTIRPLATPHAFQLSLDRKAAHPGDVVMAKMTFQNTGTADLWIPPRSQLEFGWSPTSDPRQSEVVTLSPSACNGIQYRRVARNGSLQYEKGFVVPPAAGRIYVFINDEQQVAVPLDVQ